MQVSYLRGVSVEVPDSILELFDEWFALWEGRLVDGFDGETYRSAFALGYEIGLRNTNTEAPVKSGSSSSDSWPPPRGSC